MYDLKILLYQYLELRRMSSHVSAQSLTSRALGADLHPAAKFGKGVYIAHPLGERPLNTSRAPLSVPVFHAWLDFMLVACRT